MAILTKARLALLTESRLGYRTFSEVLNEARRETRSLASVTVFLSHSHDDLENGDVNRVIVLLRKVGVRIYIDSQDSTLPPFTNAETANQLKNRIKACHKFLFLASNNSIASHWCNWELGYGDTHKYINQIALFPLSENSGEWKGAEYLKIYPRVAESDVTVDAYKVVYPDGKTIAVKDWLFL